MRRWGPRPGIAACSRRLFSSGRNVDTGGPHRNPRVEPLCPGPKLALIATRRPGISRGMTHPGDESRAGWQMFALSFTALFLEMMVIRWVPSVVHLVAYYANLMLLSSFLGLGAGALASGRRWNLFGWFPAFLAADIAMLLMDRNTV